MVSLKLSYDTLKYVYVWLFDIPFINCLRDTWICMSTFSMVITKYEQSNMLLY